MRLRLRRPTRQSGPSDRDARRSFALPRSGFQTMPRRDEEEDTASEAAPGDCRVSRFGTRARGTMTPPSPERPSTPDDLWAVLRASAFSPPSSKDCSSRGHFLFLLLLVLSRS